MITASKLERVSECPGSESLPATHSWSEAAERGTVAHGFLENVPTLGQEEALARVPEPYRGFCSVIDLDTLPLGLAAEVAFGFDIETGRCRELGRGLQRDYSSARPSEVVGTADVTGIRDRVVYIGDWKTGHGHVTEAASNLQLRFLALSAARTYGADRAVVEIIRIRDNGGSWRDRAELDIFDLDGFAAELRDIARRTAAHARPSSPQIREGHWCRYCPAFNACPAKVDLVRRLADGSELGEMNAMVPLTPEMAVTAYRRLKTVKDVVKRLENALYALARKTPISLGDGLWFGEVTKRGNERLNGDVAWQVLTEFSGREAADRAVSRTATKKAIRDVLRDCRPDGMSLAKAEKAVLARIRERNGARRTPTVSVEEYREDVAK